jgi:hypothetical protein
MKYLDPTRWKGTFMKYFISPHSKNPHNMLQAGT